MASVNDHSDKKPAFLHLIGYSFTLSTDSIVDPWAN